MVNRVKKKKKKTLCYASLVGSAIAIFKDHKIIIVYFISHDLLPRLLDKVEGIILKCQIKARRGEAEVRRKATVKFPPGFISAETTPMGVS
jgi:hypothetical protein